MIPPVRDERAKDEGGLASAVRVFLTGLAYFLLLPPWGFLVYFYSVKIVAEYERGVIFRLGRVQGAKGPGLFLILPIIDRMVRVDLRTVTMSPARSASRATT
jgi:regulator of protease activity HflC (stomatin/prohibitin superfamily)